MIGWLVLLSVLLASPAWAVGTCQGASPNWTAASPNRNDVNDCVLSAAASGDTINIPAGTGAWDASIGTITQNLVFQGAGIGQTIITLGAVTPVTDYLKLGTTTSRVTGIEWVLAGGDHIIYARGQNVRIDHNRFRRSGTIGQLNRVCVFITFGTGIAHPTILVDHNTFNDCRIYFQGDLRLQPNGIWGEGSKIGNPNQANVVYVEDNNFTNDHFIGNSVDYQYGARMVVRFNQIQNGLLEVHGMQGGLDRGSRSYEHYGNAFTGANASSTFTCHSIRSGSGMIFNETCDSSYGDFSWLDYERSYNTQWITSANGVCDGSQVQDSGLPTLGYPCRDQIGRGTDSVPIASCGSPSPCVQPSGPQANEPLYAWNNSFAGVPVALRVVHCNNDIKTGGSCADIVTDRDFYSGTFTQNLSVGTPFTGTTGVGWGIRANRPTTCTTGVAYWSTDQGGNWMQGTPEHPDITGANDGTLDKCTATNVWTNAVYTPFTYPHPLAGSSAGTLSPPTGFEILP